MYICKLYLVTDGTLLKRAPYIPTPDFRPRQFGQKISPDFLANPTQRLGIVNVIMISQDAAVVTLIILWDNTSG